MSTTEIAGRRFPSCALVCPPADDDKLSDWSRSLALDESEVFIPAENGLLFQVQSTPKGWNLNLYSPTCYLYDVGDGFPVWLPFPVAIVGGALVGVPHAHGYRMPGPWDWREADDEWLVEFIDRIAAKPFSPPDGPRVRMVDTSAKLDGTPGSIRSAS